MGAWGTALFSDDTAADVRSGFRDLIGDGLEAPAATDKLLLEWGTLVDDPDDGPVFWLALAAAQWKLGRLEDRVRDRALAVIEGGADLRRWPEGSSDRRAREAVLENLRSTLRSPPPPARKVPKRFRSRNDWSPGEVVAYRLLSGRNALLRVAGHLEQKSGRVPSCEALDWGGGVGELPPLSLVPTLRVRGVPGRPGQTQFMIGATSQREVPTERLRRLGVLAEAVGLRGPVVTFWRFVDRDFKDWFGLS